MSDYPDVGDRVVIVSDGHPNGFGGQDLSSVRGERGIIVSNDGWGRCLVRLDSGREVDAWNGADLECET